MWVKPKGIKCLRCVSEKPGKTPVTGLVLGSQEMCRVSLWVGFATFIQPGWRAGDG